MQLKWESFYYNLKRDFKLFIFVWLYLNLLRVISLITMKSYAGDINLNDILLTIYYGARISLKTAGILMLFTFIFVTLVGWLINKHLDKLRLGLSAVCLFILNFLFVAKYFYYREFHTNFNEMVFNAVNDDVKALFYTMIEQYHLLECIIIIILFTAIVVYILKKYLAWQWIKKSFKFEKSLVFKISAIVFTLVFALFVRFGASFSYAKSIHWENCAKTKDTFLNEIILDDMQAIYRGYSIKKRIDNGMIYGVHKENITQNLEFLAKNSDAYRLQKQDLSQIDSNLVYQAHGNIIDKKQHIFIIIGESFAQWPLLDEYANLQLGENVRAIMQKDNATYTHNFMPNGAFTPMAVNAIICGLSDVNIYPNHQYESYKQVYATSFAPQIKKLGYKTQFWYAGFSGWERIKDFALAQGFDEFYCASDYQYPSGNVWGCDDEFIFDKLKQEVAQNDEPTVYVILSVSNHAPYSVDLAKAGFPKEEVRAKLPADVQNNEDLLNKLGHYWYTDKVIGNFVEDIETTYPKENLFVITGDHADRTNIEAKPTLFNRYTVPCIIYGDGITKNILSDEVAGGHINIGATIFELMAPQGFEYYSLGKSLTRGANVGFNDSVWLNTVDIGKLDGNEPIEVEKTLEAYRTISWWRSIKGNLIP